MSWSFSGIKWLMLSHWFSEFLMNSLEWNGGEDELQWFIQFINDLHSMMIIFNLTKLDF